MPLIPHSRPTLGEEEATAAAQVIRSGQIAEGPQTTRFENAVAVQTGAAWGVAAPSGTAALHLALLGLDVRPGDRVAIPSYVCVALLHAVRYVGAEPVIVDVDPATMNLDPDALKLHAPARLKAVILPHLFGLPAEFDAVASLGVPVIEDCAHAIGATLRGRPVGGLGTLGICSFYATKMMTTGEGGMVVGHDRVIEARIRELRDYDRPDGHAIRFNYKMTDMQAVIGLEQLRRLPSFIDRRRVLARGYHEQYRGLRMTLPPDPQEAPHAFYRYTVKVQHNLDDLITRMEREGVACRRPVSAPIHQLVGGPQCPGADDVFARALSIPLYPSLMDDEHVRVSTAVRSVFATDGP